MKRPIMPIPVLIAHLIIYTVAIAAAIACALGAWMMAAPILAGTAGLLAIIHELELIRFAIEERKDKP